MTEHPRTLSRRRMLGSALAAGALAATTTAADAVGARPAAAADYPGPGHVTGDVRVHDPSFVKRPGGGYLVAHTGDDVALKASADRTAFRDVGPAFPGGAPWTSPYTGGARNLWAPHLSHADGRYHLYYSASTFGSNRSAIFLATSTSGDSGTWRDEGLVIESFPSDDFNAIDPHLEVDGQGRWWLAFGSFWSGIKMVRIDPATGKRGDRVLHSIAGRGGDAVEAPTLFQRDGWYYLFVSFDLCCRGADSTYRIMVGRSTSITGPYRDRAGRAMTAGGGTEVLSGHGGVHGPGHQDVFADTDHDILAYHYYADDGTALLGVNWLGWDSAGWPYVH
ncbi:arabinan endo-1,5-alpha-L-arabinosidase [Nocardiopsis dassonvillei]|uniref:arabinan endo-1,5-alpha-L-arabinosidase n=1 Tax=Nocardiopsis dassonvillei TaxID=2014 RepID=UPI000B9D57C3|nr:arabinan endo-1,5-alpha-L-arabinosidase [Nocardiopsis dassonvillei]ASU57614.1 arabinan endo-1,5-alpha-L-arabinosidase [Nocardiopsis dassonvillei]